MHTVKEIFIVPDYWEAEVMVEYPFFVEYQKRVYQGLIKATRGSAKELYSCGISWVGPSPDFRKTPAEKEIAKLSSVVPVDINSFAEDVIDEFVCHLIAPDTNPYPKELASFIPGLRVALGSQDVAAHAWSILIPVDTVIGERIFKGQVQVEYDSFVQDNISVYFEPLDGFYGNEMTEYYLGLLQESSQMVANAFLESEMGISLFFPGQHIGKVILDYIKRRRVKKERG